MKRKIVIVGICLGLLGVLGVVGVSANTNIQLEESLSNSSQHRGIEYTNAHHVYYGSYSDQTLYIYDRNTEGYNKIINLNGNVTSIDYNEFDDLLVFGTDKGNIYVYRRAGINIEDYNIIQNLQPNTNAVNDLELDSDYNHLSVAYKSQFGVIYSLDSGTKSYVNEREITDFSGNVVGTSNYNGATYFQGGSFITSYSHVDYSLLDSISPDQSFLDHTIDNEGSDLIYSDSDIVNNDFLNVYNENTDTETNEISYGATDIRTLRVSDSENLLFVADGSNFDLRNFDSSYSLNNSFSRSGGDINNVDFSSEGNLGYSKYVAVTDVNGNVDIYDLYDTSIQSLHLSYDVNQTDFINFTKEFDVNATVVDSSGNSFELTPNDVGINGDFKLEFNNTVGGFRTLGNRINWSAEDYGVGKGILYKKGSPNNNATSLVKVGIDELNVNLTKNKIEVGESGSYRVNVSVNKVNPYENKSVTNNDNLDVVSNDSVVLSVDESLAEYTGNDVGVANLSFSYANIEKNFSIDVLEQIIEGNVTSVDVSTPINQVDNPNQAISLDITAYTDKNDSYVVTTQRLINNWSVSTPNDIFVNTQLTNPRWDSLDHAEGSLYFEYDKNSSVYNFTYVVVGIDELNISVSDIIGVGEKVNYTVNKSVNNRSWTERDISRSFNFGYTEDISNLATVFSNDSSIAEVFSFNNTVIGKSEGSTFLDYSWANIQKQKDITVDVLIEWEFLDELTPQQVMLLIGSDWSFLAIFLSGLVGGIISRKISMFLGLGTMGFILLGAYFFELIPIYILISCALGIAFTGFIYQRMNVYHVNSGFS